MTEGILTTAALEVLFDLMPPPVRLPKTILCSYEIYDELRQRLGGMAALGVWGFPIIDVRPTTAYPDRKVRDVVLRKWCHYRRIPNKQIHAIAIYSDGTEGLWPTRDNWVCRA